MPCVAAACASVMKISEKTRTMITAGELRTTCLRAIFSVVEQGERRLMSAAVASDENAAVGGEVQSPSPPIGGHTPSPFDDRNHRAKIVRLQARFKDKIDEPGSEQPIGITIGTKAGQLHRRRDPCERRGGFPLKHVR